MRSLKLIDNLSLSLSLSPATTTALFDLFFSCPHCPSPSSLQLQTAILNRSGASSNMRRGCRVSSEDCLADLIEGRGDQRETRPRTVVPRNEVVDEGGARVCGGGVLERGQDQRGREERGRREGDLDSVVLFLPRAEAGEERRHGGPV
jgi:hypothetical protein